MTAVLVIDERAGALLQIPAPDGEEHSYAVDPAPEGLDAWACTLRRVGEDGHGPYRVAVSPGGAWRCSCDAWKFCKKKDRAKGEPRTCKHEQAIRPLLPFIRRLLPASQPGGSS